MNDISYMFFGCTFLKKLKVKFNTYNVNNMKLMFCKCSDELKNKMKSLNIKWRDEAFYHKEFSYHK